MTPEVIDVVVINDRYRFVFLHVPKTGGGSIASWLRTLRGNNRRWRSRGTKHETRWQFRQQWPARRRLCDRLLGTCPDGYFDFGFVRNPWDRVSSLYRYLVEQVRCEEIATVASLEDFVQQAARAQPWIARLHSMRPQVDFFRASAESDQLRADFVGHYEHLEEDLAAIGQQLRLPAARLSQRHRSSNSRVDYRQLYTSATADAVAELFADEIALFGYRFDEQAPQRRCSGPLQGLLGDARRRAA